MSSGLLDCHGDAKLQLAYNLSAAFKFSKSVLQKLLAALNECNEWGQVFLLDALAGYTPSDSREAEVIIERVTPRLQHVNSAVVLSAVKGIMKFLEKVSEADTERSLSTKMTPPLLTLLSTEPEIQYVALRNINLIVQKRPSILNEIKVFFCKYNDPICVKMDKLEITIRLVSEVNIEQVLLEFKEYATEVNVEFVRRSVRAIGRCAVARRGEVHQRTARADSDQDELHCAGGDQCDYTCECTECFPRHGNVLSSGMLVD
uniref:Clathrin/coatomer adaptor adaptin-like N-terminal domain-containing protein n=1 Tax=Phytophthora fragariae TaxID=53985 RepID=A0A6A3F9V6_9STRA|nr:hypothetical protein PF009_g8190 [Phytophthora fragariae]